MGKKSIPRIILYISLAISLSIIIFLLVVWTNSIREESKLKELKSALNSLVSSKGEEALLRLVGIPLKGVFYSDDGLILLEDTATWSYSAEEMQNIRAFEKCKNSVVEIISDNSLSTSINGCGVIISSEGYVITNGHVIGSDTEFVVNLYDGSTVDAILIALDSFTDIAVIKLEKRSEKYIPIEMNDRELAVGQKALALGSPFGYSWSLSEGIISGLDRLVYTSQILPLTNMIQTDAAINPGNSGGPLLNSKGEMIGLNTAIYSTSGDNKGISFALPLDTVLKVATDLIKDGKVTRGWLDLLSVELNTQISEYLNLPFDKGVLISQVIPSGNADRAGLRGGSERVQYGQSIIYLGGDIIVKINDDKIDGYNDYFTALMNTKAKDKVNITVYRNKEYVVIKDVLLIESSEENSRWIIR